MNREDIFRMAQEVELINKDYDFAFLNKYTDKVERFADLVASAERERIKQANAPEIERINAHIKELEDAVISEREACAKECDACICTAQASEAIRARGQA